MAADVIDYRLIGDDLQAVVVTLYPQEAVIAEAGGMMYMQDDIRMMTTLDANGQGAGCSASHGSGQAHPHRGRLHTVF